MNKIERIDTMWFEMRPDIYGGENLDKHIPMWNGYAAGDKQDDTSKDTLKFNPEDFAPGTMIVVSEPVCPKCGEVYENCMVRGYDGPTECDFDWKNWTEEQYS